jgi:fructosamine-3-kinase
MILVPQLPEFPEGLPGVGDVREARALTGGDIHATWLITRQDGTRVVVKTTRDVPPDMFAVEAEGLEAIGASGAMAAPRVLTVSPTHLVMEALAPRHYADPEPPEFWERAGRALAGMHRVRGERFGWHRDGWLGTLPQHNAWSADGYEFYAQHRLLRYLPEPGVRAVLGEKQLAALERISARLADLIPPMPPVLTHGDLVSGNMLDTPDGHAALIDPAVSYGWPEVDVSMVYCTRGDTIPDRYFDAYAERSPLAPGWRERAPLLHLREGLSLLAHFPERDQLVRSVGRLVDQVIAAFG